MLYNIVKVKIYLQINKKGCVYLWQMYPQLLIDIGITTDIVIVINNNGVVNVNQLQMVYEYELEFMANNQFILTTYTSNGNCIINVMPGGANINCSMGI